MSTLQSPLAAGKSPQIRPANFADAPAIAEIYNHYIDRGDCTMDQVYWTPARVEQWLADMTGREAWLVAVHADQVVGWGAIRQYSDREGYRVCCEESIFVRPGYLGAGVGQAMMTALLDRCRQVGFRHVVAKIMASNRPSIAFHERHGFTMVGIQNDIGYLQGEWLDVAILQCVLTDVPPPDDSP